jgi:glycosyltransferase involved in cell wall biosynthesis
MKILYVGHQGRDGIGSFSSGLQRALPGALDPDDELVVVGVTGERARRGARIVEQQLRIPFVARDADLVHLVDFRPVLLDRRRFAITVHDVCFLDHPEWFPRGVVRYKSLLLRLALAKKPAAVVCVSQYTAERLGAHTSLDVERLRVIHQAVEPPPAAPAAAGNPTFFLTISTLEPRKNHLGLLDAFRRARAQGLALRWVVAGGAGYGGERIRAELARADGVDVLGPVDDARREELYRNAAFVAVPSFVEGFGVPVLEAMARGVPVLAATGSGLDEAAGDAALTAAPSDVDAWAEALVRMASDEDLRSGLRRQGLAHIRRFDWRTAAEQHVEMYRAALGG